MRLYCILIVFLSYCHTLSAQVNPNPLAGIPKNFKYKKEAEQFVFIQGGKFMSGLAMGYDSIDLPLGVNAEVKNVILNKYEVSNGEYRQFTKYVLDSIAHSLLGFAGIIDWNSNKLDPLMLPQEERLYGRKKIDSKKIIYKFSNGDTVAVYPDTLVWIRDFVYTYNEPMTKHYFSHPSYKNYPVIGISARQAAAFCDWKTNQWNAALEAVNSKLKITVRLPDAIEWEYASLQGLGAISNNTFDFNVFDKSQTKLYQDPLTRKRNFYNKGYRYNFGRIDDPNGFVVKSYADDAFFYTAPCNAYNPDLKGFFNLHGNVAEWTTTTGCRYGLIPGNNVNALKEIEAEFPGSVYGKLSPEQVVTYFKQLTVIKGGHWESEPFYLQSGVNQYFKPAEQHCYIGFRMAVSINN